MYEKIKANLLKFFNWKPVRLIGMAERIRGEDRRINGNDEQGKVTFDGQERSV